MELSQEDSLRLNVLLASQVKAIRVDESRMSVHGLAADGNEMSIQLNPNCRDEIYLRRVRELISGQVLGSPGGYPVYLRRWNRMGQARDESLEQLLLLGEPEAVVAVVHAPGLTPELARLAWWAMPEADNARQMLSREAVVESPLGAELAMYLVEYLPFEEEADKMIETVRLVLQPGLVDETTRANLWLKGKHKNAYHLGFLWATPDDLPESQPARSDLEQVETRLRPLAEAGNPVAALTLRALSAPGQGFLEVGERILRKPVNQDVVNNLLDCLADYYAPLRPADHADREIEALIEQAAARCRPEAAHGVPGLAETLAVAPELADTLRAMQVMSRLSYTVVRPVFSRTTAIGSLMRKKLAPVIAPLFEQFTLLRRPPG